MNHVKIFVSSMNPNLLGLTINGYQLKKTLSYNEYKSSKEEDKKKLFYLIDAKVFRGLFNFNSYPYKYYNKIQSASNLYINDYNDYSYLYFEKIFSGSPLSYIHEQEHLVNSLRLYKSSNIGFFQPVDDNSAIFSDPARSFHAGHRGAVAELFSLEAEEYDKIQNFYFQTFDWSKRPMAETIKTMLIFFHESYRMESIVLRFLLRMIILEILVDGIGDLSYRISRATAILLGKTETESRLLFKTVKSLYNARSKYLHKGDMQSITIDMGYAALEISRRIIATLMYSDKSLDAVRQLLKESGYGSNPIGSID